MNFEQLEPRRLLACMTPGGVNQAAYAVFHPNQDPSPDTVVIGQYSLSAEQTQKSK